MRALLADLRNDVDATDHGDLALDLSAVTSLAGTGPDWLVRGGVSVRLGR